jgi:hypothetical protein
MTCVGAVFVLLVACRSSKSIDAGDYDRSCQSDDACVLVGDGDVCGCGDPAAIAKREEARFSADSKKLRDQCGPDEGSTCIVWPLENKRAVCRAGRCEVADVDRDAGADAGADGAPADAMADGG